MKQVMRHQEACKAPTTLSGTPSLVAAGSLCVLLANPVLGVELGELQLQSTLGQPLRASIAYALGPNEQLSSQCVYLRAAAPDAAGLPTVTRATTSIDAGNIVLRGDVALREPMMNLQVAVDCPYTAHLRRDYLVMLNPPGSLDDAVATPGITGDVPVQVASPAAPGINGNVPVQVASPVATRRAAAVRRTAVARPATPVAARGEYVVQPGDTLSEIVSRMDNRRGGLWATVDAIYAANPDAFFNRDVDRLIAGSTLEIPATVVAAAARDVAIQRSTPASTAAEGPASARGYRGTAEGTIDNSADLAPPVVEAITPQPAAAEPVIVAEPANSPATAVEESPFVESQAAAPAPAETAAEATVSIPPTRIVQQPAPVAVGEAEEASPAQAWLVWLGGSGVAIVLGLLLFGRRLREKFSRSDDLDEETQLNPAIPQRRRSDHGESIDTDDLNLSETLSQAAAIDLQVNLDSGEGFDSADDIDVALDYSFASSGDYSHEAGQAAGRDSGTDILPTMPRDESIEVQEAPAAFGEDTAGYDMSMIVDVTKQDFDSSAATTRDLQAIEVEPLQVDPGQSGTLDLTTEFDYHVLEQDYEEELTATQALNKQIAAAAMELQDRLGEFDDDQSRISMAEDLEGTAEVTAEMPSTGQAGNDVVASADDTDISDDRTAVLPDGEEITLEMDPARDGSTVEMDLGKTVQRRSKTG